jgi:hypothetical protein
VKSFLLAVDGYLLFVSSYGRERKQVLWYLSCYEGTNPIKLAAPSGPNHLSKALPLNVGFRVSR